MLVFMIILVMAASIASTLNFAQILWKDLTAEGAHLRWRNLICVVLAICGAGFSVYLCVSLVGILYQL